MPILWSKPGRREQLPMLPRPWAVRLIKLPNQLFLPVLRARKLFCLSLLVGASGWAAWFINDYYEDVAAERYIVDNHTVVVSEQLIDYEDPQQRQVECTNVHPCGNWNCTYVEEHFHKRKDFSQCDYDDNLVLVSAVLIVFSICCVLNILNEFC